MHKYIYIYVNTYIYIYIYVFSLKNIHMYIDIFLGSLIFTNIINHCTYIKAGPHNLCTILILILLYNMAKRKYLNTYK